MNKITFPKKTLESIEKMNIASRKIIEKFSPIFYKLNKNMENIVALAYKWQERKKINVHEMAKLGWFSSWYTFYDDSIEFDNLDDTMILHIDNYWEEIKFEIKKLCPNRVHILEVIFKLHEEKNYIASIPLILSQSDGIVSEEFSSFFSGRNKAPQNILSNVKNGTIKINFFTEILIEPFKIKDLQISRWSENAVEFKNEGPNRHRVLHGCKEHLDYGTRLNGYKVLSFLAFLIYTTKDEFKLQK